MSPSQQRIERLVERVSREYSDEESRGVRLLLDDLERLGTHGLDRFVRKLERGMDAPSEFRAVLREGVIARHLGECGAEVLVEAHGDKGPDLTVEIEGERANIEVKRLLRGGQAGQIVNLDDWYRDEHEADFEPEEDEGADKVEGKLKESVRQLVE